MVATPVALCSRRGGGKIIDIDSIARNEIQKKGASEGSRIVDSQLPPLAKVICDDEVVSDATSSEPAS